jgi:hypothetical protein
MLAASSRLMVEMQIHDNIANRLQFTNDGKDLYFGGSENDNSAFKNAISQLKQGMMIGKKYTECKYLY